MRPVVRRPPDALRKLGGQPLPWRRDPDELHEHGPPPAGIALIGGHGTADPNWPLDIVALTLNFSALWIVSALLFRKAVRS